MPKRSSVFAYFHERRDAIVSTIPRNWSKSNLPATSKSPPTACARFIAEKFSQLAAAKSGFTTPKSSAITCKVNFRRPRAGQ